MSKDNDSPDDGSFNLHTIDQGRGSTLVFLHGVLCSSRVFEPLVARLASRYRVMAPDWPGHGESQGPTSGHTVPAYAGQLANLLDERGVDQAILVGWSMGCFVAADYLRLFGSDRVRGLVWVDELATDLARPDYEHATLSLEQLAGFVEAIQTDYPSFATQLVAMMVHDGSPPAVVRLLVEDLLKVDPAVASTIVFDSIVRDYRGILASLQVPVLVGVGRHDALISVASAEEISQQVPDGELVVFEHSAHCPFLDQPDAVSRAIERFAQRLDFG